MKNFKLLAFVVAVMAFVFVSGCTGIHKTMREPNVFVELQKDDFTLSEQVSAEARTTRILMIDWSRLFRKETGEVQNGSLAFSVPVIGSLINDPTSSYALYNLMQANKGYDVVFYPQYETTTKRPILGLGFLYKTIDVTVNARLGKL